MEKETQKKRQWPTAEPMTAFSLFGLYQRTYFNEMSLFQRELLHLISHPQKKMLSQTKLGKEFTA